MNRSSEVPLWKVLLSAAEEAHKLGEFSRVEALLKRAVLAAGEGFEATELALVLVHLGDLFDHEGRYAESEDTYRKALSIYESSEGNDLLIAITLRNLADVLCALGRHEESADLRGRACKILLAAQEKTTQPAAGGAVLKLPHPSEQRSK